MKKILYVLLSIILVFNCVSCAKNTNNNKVENNIPTGEVKNDVIADTDIDFVVNGTTQYKILQSPNATTRERKAVNELIRFVEEATGAELTVELDNNDNFTFDQKLISVGDTSLFAKSGLGDSLNEVGNDGFRLVRKDNALLIRGGSDRGTLYGVYEFLERSFNYRFFTEDEYRFDKCTSAKLKDFNMQVKPSIAQRSVGRFASLSNTELADKLRLTYGMGNWGTWAHSMLDAVNGSGEGIMPKRLYLEKHPDWYSPDQTQLNLTNEEMKKEFVKNLKEIVEKNPTADYFMLGQADVNTFCNCEKCEELKEQYQNEDGVGGEAAIMMLFVNDVARQMAAWLKETHPDRQHIKFVTFAYMKTEPAPVSYNSATGDYELKFPELKAEENVAVMFAPLYSCFKHSILDPDCNSAGRQALLGWEKVANNLFVWHYCVEFDSIIVPFNNYNSVQQDYKEYSEHNVYYIFDQGWTYNQNVFQNLNCYVQAKLMYNVNLDFNELVRDFISAYYHDDGSMQEFYDSIRTRYEVIERESGDRMHADASGDETTSNNWPKPFIDNLNRLIDNALLNADKIQDVKLRERVKLRIKRESIFPRYVDLLRYRAYYSDSEYKQMIDSFEQDALACGITKLMQGNGGSIQDIVKGFRGNLGL